MAITREEVQAAVEQYLPRTVNFAQSADLGERDREAVFQRLLQIVLTALLLDADSIFYVVFLASQRMLQLTETVLTQLETLQDVEHLKAITGLDPSRIDDLDALTAAKNDLVALSGSIATGQFGTIHFDNFKNNIVDFLTDQIKPNVVGGNRIKTNGLVREVMGSLDTSWGDVIERRGTLFTIFPNFVGEDLRTIVSTTIIQALEQKITELERTIPTLTTSEHAQVSEQILLDLAAGEAALRVVGDAPVSSGEIISGPASDGFTDADYLELEGNARTQPLQPVLEGSDGRLALDTTLFGVTGTAVDDIDGDSLTPTFTDPSIADFASAVEVGYFLTIVSLGVVPDRVPVGRMYEVTAVAGSPVNELTLNPEIRTSVADARWAVTINAPGSFFQAETTEFWDEFLDLLGKGETASSEVVSGTLGSFPHRVRVAAGDGTNVRLTGATGEARPIFDQGTGDGRVNTTTEFEHIGATWLSDGISQGLHQLVITSVGNGNAGIYQITSIDSQSKLTITGTFPGSTGVTDEDWHIEFEVGADPDRAFADANASFLTDQVAGFEDSLHITSGTYDTDVLEVDAALTQTLLRVVPGASFPTNDIGIDYRIQLPLDRLLSASALFISNGVTVGDTLEISGTASDDGTYTIDTVYNQTEIRFSPNLSGDELNDIAFSIYAFDSATTQFAQADGVDFVASEVDATFLVTEFISGTGFTVTRPGILNVAGEDYAIVQRSPFSPTDTLGIVGVVESRGAFTSATVLEDLTTDYLAAGVDPVVHQVVVVSGVNKDLAFDIASVDSETQLTISGAASPATGEVYEIQPKADTGPLVWSVRAGDVTRAFSDTINNPFGTPANPTYPPGSILVLNPETVDELRVTIDEIIAPWLIRTRGDMPQGLTDVEYAVIGVVRAGMQLITANRKSDVVEVRNKNILEVDKVLPVSYPKNVDWHLLNLGVDPLSRRVTDIVGATVYDVAQGSPGIGFADALVGTRLDLNIQQPTVVTITGVSDPDGDGFNEGLDISTSIPLGNRVIAYRILVAGDGTADDFKSADATLGDAEADDLLTIWEISSTYSVQLSGPVGPNYFVEALPQLAARLDERDYVVMRGGSAHHGRYVLLRTLNNGLSLAEDTEELRLVVAEALLDFGQVAFAAVDTGTDGDVLDDEDGDTTSDLFTAPSATFIASGGKYGDRLTVEIEPGDTRVVYVTEIIDETNLRIDPELPLPSLPPRPWTLDRNSVSNSLFKAEELRIEMETFKVLIENYVIPASSSSTLANVLNMLDAQGMDRAIDLLYDGLISEFINMVDTSASYTSSARAAVQTAASTIATTPKTRRQVAGNNPATGKPTGSAGSLGTTSSSASLGEGSEIEVMLAAGITELVADERFQSVTMLTMEELRNRAIFELTGVIESSIITDQDPTLPWIAFSGHAQSHLERRRDEMLAALQYMLDNPDEFCDVESAEDGTA